MIEHTLGTRNEWQAARPIALRSGGFAREDRLRQPLPLRAEVSGVQAQHWPTAPRPSQQRGTSGTKKPFVGDCESASSRCRHARRSSLASAWSFSTEALACARGEVRRQRAPSSQLFGL